MWRRTGRSWVFSAISLGKQTPRGGTTQVAFIDAAQSRRRPGVLQRGMLSLSDIWRRAAEMRARFEDEAAILAAENGERCLDQGAVDGFCDWNRIQLAVQELDR